MCEAKIETWPLPGGTAVKLVCAECGEVAGGKFSDVFDEDRIRKWAGDEWLKHLFPQVVVDFQI
jgi:hypothetical protein